MRHWDFGDLGFDKHSKGIHYKKMNDEEKNHMYKSLKLLRSDEGKGKWHVKYERLL